MISWELPLDTVPCPHCGSTETVVTLQLLGLIRYACNGCRKMFAIDRDRDKGEKEKGEKKASA
jgi:transposase-like protein